MFRKRNGLNDQHLEKLSQKGASVIILALIIMVFMSITILGITKLTISEKKRAKSTSVSAEAYQKADEAMECALWGRNEIIKACSDKTIDVDSEFYNLYFPQDIASKNVYCNKYEGKIEPHHLVTDADGINTMEKIPTCASPLYISLFTSKGKVEIGEDDNAFTGAMTKQRGIGATVHTSDGESGSSLFKPYVCCNKIASKGSIDMTIAARCNSIETPGNSSVLDNDNGPGNHGWLEDHYWEPCANICLEDPCAYYNTELDPDPDEDADSLYDTGDDEREGAHWCWTDGINAKLETEGSMCNCMSEHTNSNIGDEYKYWIHPDIEDFCSPCSRQDNSLTCNVESTGNICRDMANNVGQEEMTAEQINKIWGTGGEPPESCQGVLTENNCYSCNCSTFEIANPSFCDDCTKTSEVYDCAEGGGSESPTPTPPPGDGLNERPISLSNSGSALTDYQINLTLDTQSLISDEKLQSDCDDIRFLDSGGNDLNYWIESGCNTATTKIWVKVSSIPSGDSNIYMSYGDDSLSSGSDVTETYCFYDDFSSLESWWTTGGEGSVAVTSGYVYPSLYGSGAWHGPSMTADFFDDIGYEEGFEMITRFYWDTTSTANLGSIYLQLNNDSGMVYRMRVLDAHVSYVESTELLYGSASLFSACLSPGDCFSDGYHTMTIKMSGTNLKYWKDSTLRYNGVASKATITKSYFLFQEYSTYSPITLRIDYIKVRKYASPEPTATIGDETIN